MGRSQPKPQSAAPPAALSAQAVLERIKALEERHDLLQYRVGGWCAWTLLRFSVAMELNPLNTTHSPMSYGQRLRLALEDLGGLLRLRPAPYLIKTYTSGLAEREGNRFKDVWFDELLRILGPCCKIEGVNSPIFLPRRQDALFKATLTSTLFEQTAGVLALVESRLRISGTAQALSDRLTQEPGLRRYTPRWVERQLRFFHWMRLFYGLLLGRVRPRYVLTADFGEYALAAAAKERSIPVVELQHGLADRTHPAYAWGAYAAPYKARMPVPDRIFVYGEHWGRELDAGGFWGEAIRAVGNPRLDQYRQREAPTGEQGCTVVVTSQSIDVEQIIAFLRSFLATATGRLELRLVIKLHPVYEPSKERYVQAFGDDPRVTILLGTESPSTFELLRSARFHLSISSTCHYEALGLGAATVILPFNTHDIVLPLHEAGHALLPTSPEELVELMLQQESRRSPEEVGAYYFKPDAVATMRRELQGYEHSGKGATR